MNNRKNYTEPSLNVILLSAEDVISTSNESQGEWDPQE